MANSLKVYLNVPGLKDAIASIDKYDTVSRAKIGGCIQASAINIANGAARRVSVKSGKLKKSIKSKMDLKTLTATISAKSPHAHLVEFGHKGAHEVPINKKALLIGDKYYSHSDPPPVAAHPFLRPAYEDEKPNLINNIAKVMSEIR